MIVDDDSGDEETVECGGREGKRMGKKGRGKARWARTKCFEPDLTHQVQKHEQTTDRPPGDHPPSPASALPQPAFHR